MSLNKTLGGSNSGLLLQFMLLVLLSLSFMAADYKSNAMSPVKTALSIITYPFQRAVDLPQRMTHQLGEFFSSHSRLSLQNQSYRKKLEFFSAQKQLFQDLKAENESLRKQLSAKPKNYHRFSLADILSITRGNFKRESTINMGSDRGVTVAQPILSLGNIYGQVTEVSPYAATIIQLSDPSHIIPVYNKRSGQSALAEGTGELNLLKLKDVVANADVRNGDIYLSSGFGQLFPANYPVAEVTEVTFEPDNPFLAVKAKTFVNYDKVREALLVWGEIKPIKQETPPSVESSDQKKPSPATDTEGASN